MITLESPDMAQVLIALIALANTALTLWAARRVQTVHKQVNGMRHELEETARSEGFRRGSMETAAEISEQRTATHREAMRRGKEKMDEINRGP